MEMLEAHPGAPLPGAPGSDDPEGTSLIPTLATPTPTPSLWALKGANTRAAPFPEPNFSLKNSPVPSQDERGSPGARAGSHGAHSPPGAALGVPGGGSAPLCPPRPAAAPGARAAHGPRASAERPARLLRAHRGSAPAPARPGGGKHGSEPAARSLALNW